MKCDYGDPQQMGRQRHSERASRLRGTSSSWVHPHLVEGASGIAGSGYFTIADIAKDELLVVQGGQCVHVSIIEQDVKLGLLAYHGFQVDREIYLYPFFENGRPVMEGIFLVNHSCDPNAGFRGQISLVSMRDICKGEEICIDYAMADIELDGEEPWVAQACLCKSSICRKMITGSDWMLPHLHKRYEGYFSTHVANAIAESCEVLA